MESQATLSQNCRQRPAQAGFSIVEILVGLASMGVITVALLSSYMSGVFSMHMARDNMRATQIMLQFVETIRMYTWSQVTSPNFIPTTTNFVYDPCTNRNSGDGGSVFTLQVSNVLNPVSTSYASDLVQLDIRLSWTTGSLPRQRVFSTFVARNGMQNYIY